jgi:hypothetical protein
MVNYILFFRIILLIQDIMESSSEKKTLLAVDPWNSHLITWAHGRRGGLTCLSSSAMRERARAGARLNSRVGVQAWATCGDISSDHRYYYNDSTSSAHLVALGLHYYLSNN